MDKLEFWGNEYLHEEHLNFTRQSLRFESERAAREALQIQQRKADMQNCLNKSSVFNGEITLFNQ